MAGGFDLVQNLVLQDAAEAERKKQLAEEQLVQDMAAQKAAAALSPAATVARAQRQGRTGIAPGLAAEAGDYSQLEANEVDRLNKRKLALAPPGPTPAERMTKALGPAAPFAYESAGDAAEELANDAPGRVARATAARDAMLGELAGATNDAPIYTDARRAHAGGFHKPSEGPQPEPDPRDMMLYGGALEGLRGAEVKRSAIRPEFGGTAPNETLSFTNRPDVAHEGGMQRYNSPSGRTKDVGAPGGGYSHIRGGGRGGQARDLAIEGLNHVIDVAERAPLNPAQIFGGLATERPKWDSIAAASDPNDVMQQITEAAGRGEIRPEVAAQLLTNYNQMHRASFDENGEFIPEKWQALVEGKRRRGPGEVATAVQQGGGQVQTAEAGKDKMLAEATQPVPGSPGVDLPPPAPGTTPPPSPPGAPPGDAGGAGGGLLAGLRSATQRGAQQRLTGNAPAPETPESFPSAGGIMRVAGPLAMAPFTGGASFPAAAALEGAAAGGSELLAQLMNGEDLDAGNVGTSTALGVGGGLATRLAAPLVKRGFAGVKSLGKRAMSDIPGVWQGAPTIERAGTTSAVKGSSREAAKQFSAEAGSMAPPTDVNKYLPDNLPALRGQNFSMGGAHADTSAVDELLAEHFGANAGVPPRLLLEGPPGSVPSKDELIAMMQDARIADARRAFAETAPDPPYDPFARTEGQRWDLATESSPPKPKKTAPKKKKR